MTTAAAERILKVYRFEVLRPGCGTAQGGHYYEIEIYPHPLAAALRSAGLQHSGRLQRLTASSSEAPSSASSSASSAASGAASSEAASTAAKLDKIKVAVPNDTTNEARALTLLEKNGFFKLKADAGLTATKNDIEENPP